MNFKLNYEGFETNLIGGTGTPLCGGIQYRFRFENNYGASVIKHYGSYGYKNDRWELAVIKFHSDDDNDWDLVYDTEITDDVLGFQTDENVRDLLRRIKEL